MRPDTCISQAPEDAPAPDDEGMIDLPCSSAPRASILIPTKNQAARLAACLRSLALHITAETAYETIVILNDADAEVRTLVHNKVRGIRIADSPVNLGTAGGNNRGRSLARGEFLVLIHDDSEAMPHWLESLIATADAHPEAGAVGSKIFFPDGRMQGAGWILWNNALTSPPWMPGEDRPESFDKLRPVDYCGTSSLLVRGSTWDAIGGLDENLYPAYYVDVDLCMSVRKQGQIVLFDPNSHLRHHQHSSTTAELRQVIFAMNREYFMEKWADELPHHLPYEPLNPSACRAAQAHTESVANQVLSQQRMRPPAVRPAFDEAHQLAMHRLRQTALRRIIALEKRCLHSSERAAEASQRSKELECDLESLRHLHSQTIAEIDSLKSQTTMLINQLRKELEARAAAARIMRMQAEAESNRLSAKLEAEKLKKAARTADAARWKSRAGDLVIRLKNMEKTKWWRARRFFQRILLLGSQSERRQDSSAAAQKIPAPEKSFPSSRREDE